VFSYRVGGVFLSDTYPNVSCMYRECILEDTCILMYPDVSQMYLKSSIFSEHRKEM
jgi:hypothetical protein